MLFAAPQSVEYLSWWAGVLGAATGVLSVGLTVLNARAARRDLVEIAAAATGRPELVETLRAAAQERTRASRRRIRAGLAATVPAVLICLGLVAAAAVVSPMLLTVPLAVVAGDRPRIEVTDQCGEGACLTYQKWALPAAGSRMRSTFAVTETNRLTGPARATLVTRTFGCANTGTVTWEVLDGDATVATGQAGATERRKEFALPPGRTFTVTAVRADGGACPLDLRIHSFADFS